jgi:hypothetical protein
MDECSGDSSDCGNTMKLPLEKVIIFETKNSSEFSVLFNNVVSV